MKSIFINSLAVEVVIFYYHCIFFIVNHKNNKKNFLLAKKFYGLAKKTEKFFINYVFLHEINF